MNRGCFSMSGVPLGHVGRTRVLQRCRPPKRFTAKSCCHLRGCFDSNRHFSAESGDRPQSVPAARSRVFSGIQPTGTLHLGNYLGAVKLWRDLQEGGNCLIASVVDMHAITLPWKPSALSANVRQMFIQLLACGIDPEKTILFQQSTVPEHAQLQWIFACLTTMARIDNLPHYKEKSAPLQAKKVVEGQPLPNQPDAACGLLMYPILQAADILLYRAELVPVGEDQVHHLQLAQHIARVFNHQCGKYFTYPQRVHSELPRVKSLRDPEKKMSKSDPDIRSRIDLTDSPEQIHAKLKKSITDSTAAVTYEPETRPGISNLLALYRVLTGGDMDAVVEEVKNMDKVTFKARLADVLIELLRPIRERIGYLEMNVDYVDQVMRGGTEKARCIASETMADVNKLVGFSNETCAVNAVRKSVERKASVKIRSADGNSQKMEAGRIKL